jgi:hypothetical protein
LESSAIYAVISHQRRILYVRWLYVFQNRNYSRMPLRSISVPTEAHAVGFDQASRPQNLHQQNANPRYTGNRTNPGMCGCCQSHCFSPHASLRILDSTFHRHLGWRVWRLLMQHSPRSASCLNVQMCLTRWHTCFQEIS